MPFPPGPPSLREFIDAAVSQGAREGHVRGLVGAKGFASGHYLVGRGENGACCPLPEMSENDPLPISKLRELVKNLQLAGFDDLLEGVG